MENLLPIGICIGFFILQSFLCFKVKNLFVRLLPVIIFPILTLIFGILATTTHDWDAIAYMVFAIFGGIFTLVCGGAWLTWYIVKLVQKRQQ